MLDIQVMAGLAPAMYGLSNTRSAEEVAVVNGYGIPARSYHVLVDYTWVLLEKKL